MTMLPRCAGRHFGWSKPPRCAGCMHCARSPGPGLHSGCSGLTMAGSRGIRLFATNGYINSLSTHLCVLKWPILPGTCEIVKQGIPMSTADRPGPLAKRGGLKALQHLTTCRFVRC